jgi:hypothetical protein
MNSSNEQKKNKIIESGKLKGTSAFRIKQTKNVEEISWSNNKFESTYTNNNKEGTS